MKRIAIAAVLALVTVGTGCARTAVVLGKDSVSVATEGPVFLYSMTHLRDKAIRAAIDALEACGSASTNEAHSQSGTELGMEPMIVKDLKSALDFAKTAASLIPMRTFTLNVDASCPQVAMPQ